MFFLIVHIVFLSGFGLIFKYAGIRGHQLNPIGATGYFVAFLLSIWSVVQANTFEFSRLTLAFGLTNGVSYAVGMGLVILGMRLSGIIVTIAVIRLSLIVPILFAIFFWDEIPNIWQTVGIVLACCALPLLGSKPTPIEVKQERGIASGLGLFVVTILFVNSGIGRLAMKAFNEECPIDQKPMYLLFLFGTTAIAYAGVCIYQKIVPTRWEVFYGLLLGICNIVGSWAFLKSLDQIDALIAFLVAGSGGVLCTLLIATLLLGERLDRKSMVGVVATILSLVFVNLKGE